MDYWVIWSNSGFQYIFLGTSTGYADGDESHKRKQNGDSTEHRKRCLIRTPESCVVPTRELSIENPGKYFYEILLLRVSKFVFFLCMSSMVLVVVLIL